MKKAVFIRLDKIGDLVCTLPVDQIESLQDWQITWVIAKGLAFLPEHADPKRTFIELDKNKPHESRKKLEAFLKEFKPDVAISFQTPWWVNFALWICRVPQRIGVLSQWHSFLFLNRGLRQRRSQATQHEADYNLDLVRQISGLQVNLPHAPVLCLKAVPQPQLLDEYDLDPKEYMVVHPGMAGSALNWPIANYIELIENLILRYRVVLTGTPADEPWIKDIRDHFKNETAVVCLQNKLNTKQLLYILEQAHTVFAPSTGVLHMAASLGTQVYGFYSPMRVQAIDRWGARGPHVCLYAPKLDPDAEVDASCMSEITVEHIVKDFR